MKSIRILFAAAAVIFAAAALSSCEKKTFEMWYEFQLEPAADGPMYPEEKALLEKAFADEMEAAFGFRAKEFCLKAADISDTSCDEEVKEACLKAESKLSSETFESIFNYDVRNTTTGKLVYRYSRPF